MEGGEGAGVGGGEGCSEQQDREGEPGGVGTDWGATPEHKRGPGCDERHGAQSHVESPWHSAQQQVARYAQAQSGAEDREPEPGPRGERRRGAHPAARVGRPPKRRSRARNVAMAAAKSAALKSGHIVSVNTSSA